MDLDLAAVRLQVRLDDDDSSEDELLTLYIAAAKNSIESYLHRTVNWEGSADDDTSTDTDTDEEEDTSIDVTDDLILAALLQIAHWYKHREAVSSESTNELRLGFRFLCDPYRDIQI